MNEFIKQSIVFFVDSSSRNKTKFPNPNDYTVRFSEPFKNVCSIEILDVSIPRTEYVINVDNNVLVVLLNNESFFIELEHGDYNVDTFIAMVNKLLSVHNMFIIQRSPARKEFVIKSKEPFEIDVNNSTSRNVLGLDKNSILQSERNHMFFEEKTIQYILNTRNDFEFDWTLTDLLVFRQKFRNPNDNMHLKSINIPNAIYIGNRRNIKFKICIYDDAQNLLDESISTKLSFDLSSEIQSDKDYYFELYAIGMITNQDYKIILPLNIVGETFNIITRDQVNIPSHAYRIDNGLNTLRKKYFSSNDIDVYFSLDVEIVGQKKFYSLACPCRYDLSGERYTILRCKEIETHIMTSLKFSKLDGDDYFLTQGIAKIKLNTLGYQDERFDYNMTHIREFHPIGKLPSLTFRFEKSNGALYDFKGINHTLTVRLNMYIPPTPVFETKNVENVDRLEAANENIQYYDIKK